VAKKKQRSSPKKPKFEIEYAEEVYGHLDVIESKYYRTIQEAIFEQLSHTPNVETRNRKPLEPPAPFEATWEIRFGQHNEFRALYEVKEAEKIVYILAIGIKDGNRLIVGKEEFET
jgi:mRNA-degrading endonuclease RelE of RelBE toxin-antitoxin system